MHLRPGHDHARATGVMRRRVAWTCRLTLVALLALASTASAAPQLPDLVADAPGPSERPEIYNDGTQRLLMRLDGFVHNRGGGALEVGGSGPSGGRMSTVRQRVYDSTLGLYSDNASPVRMWFEEADGHDHWHVMNAMRYSLWSADRGLEAAPAQKVGFCLIDSERIETHGPTRDVYTVERNNFCGQGNPNLSQLVVGVSAGWRDIYDSGLAFQWVDVSDVAPGSYWLRADADPDGVIAESDETNVGTYADSPSVVNGYLAQPVDAGTVPAGAPSAIDLKAMRFDDAFAGSPGQRQFRIVSPPSSGSLDKPTGEWFSGAGVNYTPSPGQRGPVSFTFAARDATSAFPRNARSAAVTLTVAASPGPSPGPGPGPAPAALAISGAPQSVLTSSVTPLTATGPGAADGVSWSVNGLVGGSPPLGPISAGGVYTAPASPPPGGAVTIGARSAAGAVATVVLRIVQAPEEPQPAPSSTPPAAGGRLSRLVLARQRRTLIAVVVPGRYGRLRFVARRGKQRIGRCSMMARAGVAATCSMKLSRKVAPHPFEYAVPRTKGLKLPGVSVTVTLRYGGKQRAIRRARAH